MPILVSSRRMAQRIMHATQGIGKEAIQSPKAWLQSARTRSGCGNHVRRTCLSQGLGLSSRAKDLVAKGKRSAVGRRPVIKADLGAKIGRLEDRRNHQNGGPRRLKEGQTGSGSRPLEPIAEKVLPLRICRMGLDHPHVGAFRTQYGVTSRKAYRENADG